MNTLIYLSQYNPDFEQQYIALRKKEGRILSDEQLKLLPDAGFEKHLDKEWKIRKKTAEKFVAYLSEKSFKKVLEVGCGNGWFANKLSKIQGLQITGLDINKPELEQAIRVFGNTNPAFFYGDIFETIFERTQFDLIVLNASVQYFADFKALISRLRHFLTVNGEIHIINSHFYPEKEVQAAKIRTTDYYTGMGFPEMSKYYYHHSTKDLQSAGAEYLYKPGKSIFSGLFNYSPFPWVKIRQEFVANAP